MARADCVAKVWSSSMTSRENAPGALAAASSYSKTEQASVPAS